jgi:fido (protein-threonine AMPylation protein)
MSKLFFATDTNTAKKLSGLAKQREIRRVYRGIYTDNLVDPLEKIIKTHWMQIVPHIVSKGILSFRTAVDLKPFSYKRDLEIVFVTSSYVKTIKLPGLIIKVYKGNFDSYCEHILPYLAKSNVPRMLLENLNVVKSAILKGIKTIEEAGVEKYLARELQFQGEKRLNQIRDEAKEIAFELGYHHEYKKLTKTISALLTTHQTASLKTPYAKAVALKESYNENRLQAFETLSLYLQKCIFKKRVYDFTTTSFRNLSFFESYFSNFIEGTEFVIDEAEDIVFKGVEINLRHADSHDILANFYLANDYLEMNKTPENASEFLEILKTRHAYLMKERPEKEPGEFKQKPNRAGNTYFVQPHDVVGTLKKGFEIYQLLEEGLQRALFIHYLISEVHPFNDGNGRLSRIMMNAELVKAGLFKIIMPTVCRENYLGALRRATRDRYFQSYCKVMDQAQAYTESIHWAEYGDSRTKIEFDCANKTPDEGLPIFNRALRLLALSALENN